jgi:hypothetical protein
MHVRLLCLLCFVGSGLCDGLITRSEESYRVCVCLIVCDLETSTVRRPRTEFGCCAAENNESPFVRKYFKTPLTVSLMST